ncbi:MAG TPA: alanine racemase [Candidatus Elarobacter sp.]|nr:alanine racemase [Candidatus Elarobacter sp.]
MTPVEQTTAPATVAGVETPAAVVDLDRLAANLDRAASYAALHGIALRPHVKTHKSPLIAREQLRRGAAGLTCATVREVEVMADVTNDVLFAYPPVGGPRLRRLLSAPANVRLTVSLDSEAAIDALGATAAAARRTVRVYVEADVGMHRVGVTSADRAVALARRVAEKPSLEYAGLAFYAGHIRQPPAAQDERLARLNDELGVILDALSAAGLRPPVVSGGSTPTLWRTHELPAVTEIRPGTYVYNDRATADLGACALDDCALTVLATVVSTSVPDQAVVDAGTKALGREPLDDPSHVGFGAVADHPEVVVSRMSEEHGILDLRGTSWRPATGDLVRIIPNHVCVVVHLNDVVYGVRGENVEMTWPVAARGRI